MIESYENDGLPLVPTEVLKSPEKWDEYKKLQIREIAGKLEYKKSEKFADYLNARFLDVAQEQGAAAMARMWHELSNSDKMMFAQQVVNRTISVLNSDMQSNRIKIHNAKAVHNPNLKINVCETGRGLMNVSQTKKLGINLEWPLYKSMVVFLMDLRHEMMHVVDMFIPQISTLKPTIRQKSLLYYVNDSKDYDLYLNNPLELNANLKRKEFRIMVQEMLAAEEQRCAISNKLKQVQIGNMLQHHR